MELLREPKFFLRRPALCAWLDQIVEFGNTRLGEQPWKADIRVMRPASMERADGRRFWGGAAGHGPEDEGRTRSALAAAKLLDIQRQGCKPIAGRDGQDEGGFPCLRR